MVIREKSAVRDRLRQLVDEIPELELPAAKRYLEYLRNVGNSPVYRAVMEAPLDNEPETEEERLAVEEGRADIAAGRLIPHEQVMREFLGDD